MAVKGFCTTLPRMDLKISRSPPGGVELLSPAGSLMVMGKRKLEMTAITAAISVLPRYSTMTVVKRLPMPPEALARELMTSTNTSRGAMPFSAPTNRSPRMVRKVACGVSSPNRVPSTRPISILMIREVPFQILPIAFMEKTPFIFYRESCDPGKRFVIQCLD